MKPNLDLTIESLAAACKGNINALPSFMVHDNDVWPWPDSVKLDGKNRIHMRRLTFEHTVAGDLPVKPGIWHRIDVQEFHLDLQPHHIQASDSKSAKAGHMHSRPLVLSDQFGRPFGDADHGTPISKSNGISQSDFDAARNEIKGEARGVRSTAIHSDDSD